VRGPKSAPVGGDHEPFWFSDDCGQHRRKAMPVILTSPAEVDSWPGALGLQRPLPDDALRIVEKREKEDAPPQS
jgi:hypothetical protein